MVPLAKILTTCFWIAFAVCVFLIVHRAFGGESAFAATCHYRDAGALPDRYCTPGAINHDVTQANIHQTICVPGWSSAHRPPVSVTEPEKWASMAAYGYPNGPWSRVYEFDHLIPIELGGALNDIRNLWPEPRYVLFNGLENGSYAKDKMENNMHRLVCAGKVKLWLARKYFRMDWRGVPGS